MTQAGFGAVPAAPLFIATGTDKRLYIRSLTTGWQLLGSVGGSCVGGPAAVVSYVSSPLTVACRGLDNALWENTTTWSGSGLPKFTGPWTSLGGELTAGPAVATPFGQPTFYVRGTNGRILDRTLSTGYYATAYSCIGQPAEAFGLTSGVQFFACQGTDHALWEAGAPYNGAWSTVSLGGVIIGGPAIAAATGETELLAEGTDHVVWQRTPAGWSSLGGVAVGGVGAVALN